MIQNILKQWLQRAAHLTILFFHPFQKRLLLSTSSSPNDIRVPKTTNSDFISPMQWFHLEGSSLETKTIVLLYLPFNWFPSCYNMILICYIHKSRVLDKLTNTNSGICRCDFWGNACLLIIIKEFVFQYLLSSCFEYFIYKCAHVLVVKDLVPFWTIRLMVRSYSLIFHVQVLSNMQVL